MRKSFDLERHQLSRHPQARRRGKPTGVVSKWFTGLVSMVPGGRVRLLAGDAHPAQEESTDMDPPFWGASRSCVDHCPSTPKGIQSAAAHMISR